MFAFFPIASRLAVAIVMAVACHEAGAYRYQPRAGYVEYSEPREEMIEDFVALGEGVDPGVRLFSLAQRDCREGLLGASPDAPTFEAHRCWYWLAQAIRANSEPAYDLLLEYANAGDIVAANAIGVLSLTQGQIDAPPPGPFFTMGADQGFPLAQYNLALWLRNTGGEVERIVSLLRASSNDVPAAGALLGELMLTHDAFANQRTDGITILQQSAEQGESRAMVLLSIAFDAGIGVEPDGLKATGWARLAADQGDIDGIRQAGYCLSKYGDDPREAVRYYRLGVEAGDPESLFNLALAFEHGRGVEQDIDQALHYFEASGSHGLRQALAAAGSIHVLQQAATSNPQEGLILLRKAAQLGDGYANYILGFFHWEGMRIDDEEILAPDLVLAEKYLRTGMEAGNHHAYRTLASLYTLPDGPVSKPELGVRMLKDAWARGDTEVEYELADAYLRGVGGSDYRHEGVSLMLSCAERGTPECLARLPWLHRFLSDESGTRAEQILMRAADSGQPSDMANAAQFLYHAKRPGPDGDYGFVMLRELHEGGHDESANSLAYSYLNGRGTTCDFAEGRYVAETCHQAGGDRCSIVLAGIYRYGLGVDVDATKAMDFYAALAENGDNEAMYHLGVMYYEGEGVGENREVGIGWLQRSIDAGNTWANLTLAVRVLEDNMVDVNVDPVALCQTVVDHGIDQGNYCLGLAHEIGYGTPPDAELAADYYRQVSKGRTDREARFRLARLMHDKRIDGSTQQADTLLRSAARAGEVDAMDEIVSRLQSGLMATAFAGESAFWSELSHRLNGPAIRIQSDPAIKMPIEAGDIDAWEDYLRMDNLSLCGLYD